MRRIVSILACSLGLAALPANAQTAGTEVALTVAPACVQSGDSFTVFATGLQPGESYDFLIDPVPTPLEAGAIVEADHTGVGVLDGTIPADVEVDTGEFTWSVEPSGGNETLATADFRIAALCPVTERGSGTFVDDDGSTHEGHIEAIAAEGITLGCNPPTNDRFCPDQGVTRAEMAAFLVRSLDLEASDADPFIDDDGRELEADINALAAAGITLGCNPPEGDRFCPDDPVTRGQMAAFLVRGFDYTGSETGNRFVDDDDSPFESEIEALASAGVTLGCNPPEGDRFCPEDVVARDQMASFLGRALDLAPRPPVTLEPSTDDRESQPYPGERGGQLVEIRTEQHGFFDRIVFEFDEIPGWSTRLQDPPVLADASGLEIAIEGEAFLDVVFNPAAAQWAGGNYDGPDRIEVAGGIVTEVVESGDFEGVNSWAIGLTADAAYAVATLNDPARVVIDVMHG
jgi:hypothetical protein